MLGYLIPAWGFATQPGVFPTTCVTDQDDKDQRGHQHKLETESVGPAAANAVAEDLAALLDQTDAQHARIAPGRFVLADGTLSRFPQGAVGIWVDDGSARGLLVAVAGIAGFGDRPADRHGTFIDYDAASQTAPDLLTHGMAGGGLQWFVDVYPDVTGPALGGAHP